MKIIVALFAASILSISLSLHAQELPPPPPPPGVEEGDDESVDETESVPAPSDTATEDDPSDSSETSGPDESPESADGAPPAPSPQGLTITEPTAGAEIATATVVRGTAAPRSAVEIWIDDALEQRMKADANGQFKATVSGLEAGRRVRIEVRQIDASGEVVANTSVVGRVSESVAAETVENPAIVDESPPEEPAPLAERNPVTEQPAQAPPGQELEAPVGQVARGAISTAAGVLAGSAGLGFGFFGGLLVGAILQPDSFAFLAYAVFGAAIGYATAMPLAVYLTGYLLDGDGNALLTVLATYGGIGASVVVAGLMLEATNGGSDAGALATFVGVSLVGSAAGALVFEATSNPSRKAAEQAEGELTVVPSIAPSADGRGAVFGLGGTW